MFYPLLQTKDNSTKIIKEPVYSFNDFFSKEYGMVSQMRGGKIDSNYDLDEDGNIMFFPPQLENTVHCFVCFPLGFDCVHIDAIDVDIKLTLLIALPLDSHLFLA